MPEPTAAQFRRAKAPEFARERMYRQPGHGVIESREEPLGYIFSRMILIPAQLMR